MEMFHSHVSPLAQEMVGDVLRSHRLSEGMFVDTFERELTKQLGLQNPVAVNSGTSAIHLALALLGVGPGDEVIIPAQTFVATGMAVLYCGAKVVFADINPNTGNISPESVREKITDRTKAVIPVHWVGYPCDLAELFLLSRDYSRLAIIEDAAHALGAVYNGVPIGNRPLFTAFSFQATKHLTTGDGGLLCCRYVGDTSRAKRLRWFGIDKSLPPGELGERSFNVDEIGYKYHMNNISAALGLANLEGFLGRLEQRRTNAEYFRTRLGGVPGVTLLEAKDDRSSAHYAFPLLVENRMEFCRKLASYQVPCSVIATRIDKYTVFGGQRDDLPGQDYFDKHQINLPVHEALTEADRELVVETIRSGW